MNFVREYKKRNGYLQQNEVISRSKSNFADFLSMSKYYTLSQYVDWIINKIHGFFFKKKAQKTTTTKTKMAKTDKFRTMYRYYTLQNTQHIHTTLQEVRRSKNDRTTQQLQEHSNFQWDNTTNDHISKVK